MILDTGAFLNTGSLDFLTLFAKHFPYLVDRIIVAGSESGYNPIGLSGIIHKDTQHETSTELPVVFCLKLPYKNSSDEPTILKVACGRSVSVTFLLGLPFLKKSQAKICL